jgi:putative transposase
VSRPLRIEFPGAVCHVTSRGDRREDIYRDDADRRAHVNVLAQAKDRFGALLLAYCQMGNHFHLVRNMRNERPDPGSRDPGSRRTMTAPPKR